VGSRTDRDEVIGHFFGAIQSDGFIDKDEFKKTDRRLDSSIPQHQTRPENQWPVDPGGSGRRCQSGSAQRRDTAVETGGE